MAIRLPSAPDHAAQVAAFRAALRTDDVDRIVERMLDPGLCFCIEEETRNTLTTDIIQKFQVEDASCVFVGSAQLGFSTVEKKDRPRYRPFSAESDIDIAIISSAFFDRIWEETFLHFIEDRPWPLVQEFQKYFFRGWIRPDKLPYNSTFRSGWFDYFRQLSRDQLDSAHSITCAVYKSDVFLKEYQKRSIRDCRDAEEVQ